MSLRRANHSSRGVLPTVVRRCVWSRNLNNEEAMTRVGLQRHSKIKVVIQINVLYYFWFTLCWLALMFLGARRNVKGRKHPFYLRYTEASLSLTSQNCFSFPLLHVDAREIIQSSTTSNIELPHFLFKLLEHFSGRVAFHTECGLNNFLFFR
jgi:hypothetical protein